MGDPDEPMSRDGDRSTPPLPTLSPFNAAGAVNLICADGFGLGEPRTPGGEDGGTARARLEKGIELVVFLV